MGVNISIEESFSKIEPGGKLKVKVVWTELKASSIDVNLIWSTSGKGDADIEIVASRKIEEAGESGERSLEFDLPEKPYSFSGRLISLHWAVEAVPDSNEDSEVVEFVLSPTGKEVVLADSVDDE